LTPNTIQSNLQYFVEETLLFQSLTPVGQSVLLSQNI